jgi:hypothetical protein
MQERPHLETGDWPWEARVKSRLFVGDLDRCPDVHDIFPEIPKLPQNGHRELSEEQFRIAVGALVAAIDPDLGDMTDPGPFFGRWLSGSAG